MTMNAYVWSKEKYIMWFNQDVMENFVCIDEILSEESILRGIHI